MAEIVNLRRARKAKARVEADADAQANRAKFGLTKAEKAAQKDADRRGAQHLAGHRLDPTRK